MSILSFLLKPKKEMAKPKTKWVKIGKYKITSHAQNRIVDPSRNLTKSDMVINLFGKSINSKNYEYVENNGIKTIQYDRVNPNNRTITHITKNNNVRTIHKYGKRRKKYAFKNF